MRCRKIDLNETMTFKQKKKGVYYNNFFIREK